MHRYLYLLLIATLAGCVSSKPPVTPSMPATSQSDEPFPLLEAALGPFSRPVTTSSPEAQAYMDQGFQMMYAFAAGDAPKSFKEAQKHDPECAMCFWAEAWSHGPYLNGGMSDGDAPIAFDAIQKAIQLTPKSASAVEKALIDAMVVRFEKTHEVDRREQLDTLYANAMEDVYKRFPADTDVGTLYAESLMLLEPRRGRWKADDPDVKKIHRVLEDVLARDIRHPGACHLYIHATESTTRPEKAEACAEYLGNSIPGASHINHMPSHTFNRVGRWGEAVRANIQAWHSDLKAEINEGFAIYPSHNLHMLLFAASMDGQGAIAIQAGKDYAKIVNGGEFYQMMALIRFGRFDEALELGEAPKRPIFREMWNFGKGYAQLRAGNVKEANQLLAGIEKAASTLTNKDGFRGHPPEQLLGILGGILRAEIDRAAGRLDAAITTLKAAVELEDELQYDEPEPLNFSARHWLGDALLEAGRPKEAEAVFHAALEDHPNNGWSLFGLEQALREQSRQHEADKVHAEFEKAWARSDTWIRGAVF